MTNVAQSCWRQPKYYFMFFTLVLEVTQLYCQFGSGGPILLIILEMRHHLNWLIWEKSSRGFLFAFQSYAGCWLEFHFYGRALPGGLVTQMAFSVSVQPTFRQSIIFNFCVTDTFGVQLAGFHVRSKVICIHWLFQFSYK